MMQFSQKQSDAILAGLRLLQASLDNHRVLPNEGDIGDILTDTGSHKGMTADEIDRFCQEFNCGAVPTVVLEINGGVLNCARASEPVRLVVLDEDAEGGDSERIKEINGEGVYVTDYRLAKVVTGGFNGVDPGFVANVIEQLDVALHASDVENPDSDESPVIYLTNACGDETGYGTIMLEEADYAKVAFEDGPGDVLPYIAEIDGVAYVLGNLEVAHKDGFCDDGDDLPPEHEALAYCQAACEYIRPRLATGMHLLPLDDGEPGRIIIRVAIPLHALADSEATRNALSQAFGELVDLPDEVPVA
jgi:hypothetical protein